ncbi:glutamate racemase [Pantoea agglomerans]|uniref:glutamate racemase n=1 Tax=Enterobacter agglomerans TaxID=549 RepID=UPI000E1BBC5A|nr:glutamate racemase [Pantoea agglomerans]
MNILCFHTAASNIAIFDDAASALARDNPPLNHLVMPALLAEALQRQAGRTVALCAAESTLAATRTLFCQPGSQVEVALVEGAWTAFKAGEATRYFALIAAAAEQAYQQGAVAVALAQSSMTPVAQQFPDTQRPLTGPHLALQACYELR